jgi:hypothetical protein
MAQNGEEKVLVQRLDYTSAMALLRILQRLFAKKSV